MSPPLEHQFNQELIGLFDRVFSSPREAVQAARGIVTLSLDTEFTWCHFQIDTRPLSEPVCPSTHTSTFRRHRAQLSCFSRQHIRHDIFAWIPVHPPMELALARVLACAHAVSLILGQRFDYSAYCQGFYDHHLPVDQIVVVNRRFYEREGYRFYEWARDFERFWREATGERLRERDWEQERIEDFPCSADWVDPARSFLVAPRNGPICPPPPPSPVHK